jgi:hypothetical protein
MEASPLCIYENDLDVNFKSFIHATERVRISGSVELNPRAGEKVLLRYQTCSEEEYSWQYITQTETDSKGRYTAT